MYRLLAAVLLLMLSCCAQEQSEHPYTVEKVMGSLEHASGVAWLRDHLLIADIASGRITKLDTEGASTFRKDTHATAIAADAENRVYIADGRNHKLLRIDRKGNDEVLASEWEGKPLLGPTSVAVSKNNHIFFTDSAWASEDRNKPRPYYALFHITPKGELSLAAKMTTRPAGAALSPDGKTLYVVNADLRTVSSWQVDKAGALSGERVLFRTKSGVPNGIAVAPDGTLYAAAGRIEVFRPSGEPLYYIELSEKPADITLGDSNLANLYVAARTGLYRVRLGAKGSSAD